MKWLTGITLGDTIFGVIAFVALALIVFALGVGVKFMLTYIRVHKQK
jgi:hypothetical protein